MKQFKQVLAGLFTSKLTYGIAVWSAIWNIPGNLETDFTRTSISKSDIRKLQVLQNKALRLVNRTDRSESTQNLLNITDSLSVHQLAAYTTLNEVHGIKNTCLPAYHHERLFEEDLQVNRRGQEKRVEFKLSLARGSFFYQGSKLWSAIPQEMKSEQSLQSFKNKSKQWVRANVKIRP